MAQKGEEILERVLKKSGAPSLSTLAVRLIELASSEDSSAADLAEVIEHDPGLTARLLRLVNSPAYRRSPDEITSVTRAVVLLGLREVRIMALSISLRDTLPVKKGGQDYKLYWRASLHRAALARQTAEHIHLKPAEDAFVAGLLLELGLPLLLHVLTPEESQGFPGVGAALEEQLAWERRNLELDHRELGRQVMQHWGLPQTLIQCQQLVDPQAPRQAPPLVRVCDFARRATETFFLPHGRLDQLHPLAKQWFDLEPEDLNRVMAAAVSFVGQTAQALEIELDTEADLLEVMEKANAALSRLVSQVEPAIKQAARGLPDPNLARDDARRLQEQAMVNALEAVAHEIRNPLMSVGGFARRLASKVEDSQRAQQYAKVIMEQASRLDQVLNEMLSLISPFEPQLQSADLTALLAQLKQDLEQHPLSCREGTLTPKLAWHLPAKPIITRIDPQGITQAVQQVLAYGCHLLDPNGNPTLHLHLGTQPAEALITVFGPGSPNAGENDPLAGKSFGPELGLAKARRVIEAHDGYLSLGSAPQGGGFVLTLSLPVTNHDS